VPSDQGYFNIEWESQKPEILRGEIYTIDGKGPGKNKVSGLTFSGNQSAGVYQQNSFEFFTIALDKEHPLEHPITCSIDVQRFKDKTIIIVDDVINSGKTMQYAVVKILEQSIKSVKTVALVDRMHRRYPIKCDFVGMTLTTTLGERVEVIEKEGQLEAYLV
jgi:hypothetical protein